MRFLIDECTGPGVAFWLRELNYDVFSVFEENRGMDDDNVIRKAYEENRILITNDKDFGEKIYREKIPHRGVILLRLENERVKNKIAVLRNLLNCHREKLPDRFTVVKENQVRFGV